MSSSLSPDYSAGAGMGISSGTTAIPRSSAGLCLVVLPDDIRDENLRHLVSSNAPKFSIHWHRTRKDFSDRGVTASFDLHPHHGGVKRAHPTERRPHGMLEEKRIDSAALTAAVPL
jgi:hypothetical protein